MHRTVLKAVSEVQAAEKSMEAAITRRDTAKKDFEHWRTVHEGNLKMLHLQPGNPQCVQAVQVGSTSISRETNCMRQFARTLRSHERISPVQAVYVGSSDASKLKQCMSFSRICIRYSEWYAIYIEFGYTEQDLPPCQGSRRNENRNR